MPLPLSSGLALPLLPSLRRSAACAVLAAGCLLPLAGAEAAEMRIDPGRSTLLVKLYKDGPASAFAHDHVVAARRFTGTIKWDPARPEETRVQVVVEAATLDADEPGMRRHLSMSDMSEGTSAGVLQKMVGDR